MICNMNMLPYKESFDTLMKVKKEPNTFELELLVRTKKYVRFIAWIPGIEMVAVVNSLAMYATHKESDIDLFIITKP